MNTQHCLKHMDIERWILKPKHQTQVTLMVVMDQNFTDMPRAESGERLLTNMLNSLGLNGNQVVVCAIDHVDSCISKTNPRIILALGTAGLVLQQRTLPGENMPLICSHDLLEILNKPWIKKTVQDDLALIQAWLNN